MKKIILPGLFSLLAFAQVSCKKQHSTQIDPSSIAARVAGANQWTNGDKAIYVEDTIMHSALRDTDFVIAAMNDSTINLWGFNCTWKAQSGVFIIASGGGGRYNCEVRVANDSLYFYRSYHISAAGREDISYRTKMH